MSASPATDWFRRAAGEPIRLEAFIAGPGYAPHRHDSYAIALTLQGVQSFRYRGGERHSLPGGVVVMHPDELHDGHAGTDEGMRYRVLYVEPGEIQRVLGGQALPFLETGVSTDPRLQQALTPLLAECTRAPEGLEYEDGLFELATALRQVCGAGQGRALREVDYRAVELARDYLRAHWDEAVDLAALERISQRDRWKLSRDFRAAFGTSPFRYLGMRRLEQARALIAAGQAIADAAAQCGFADQSHLTRQFRKAFGMTPRQWLGIRAHDRSIPA